MYEVNEPAFSLKPRNVSIKIHSINAFDFQHNMIFDYFGNVLRGCDLNFMAA
jgi:hypothetical protein